ncbi:MAG: hypothetical protein ACR2QG_05850 [Gammaproteobacteria bacterium]
MKSLTGVLLVSFLMAGCGGSADDPDYVAKERERRKAAEERETVFDPMTSTIDRAGGVNEINLGRTDRLDEALDESDE